MTTKLKLALAVFCLAAMAAPAVMAQTAAEAPAAEAPAAAPAAAGAKEFIPGGAQNLPVPGRPAAVSRSGCGTFPNVCNVPEPGSLPLIAAAALAAAVVMRRKK